MRPAKERQCCNVTLSLIGWAYTQNYPWDSYKETVSLDDGHWKIHLWLHFIIRATNSLAPGRFQWSFRKIIFKLNLLIDGWGISCKIGLDWVAFVTYVLQDILTVLLIKLPSDECYWAPRHDYLEGLVQDCSISIANALEILQFCTKPSIWTTVDPDLCLHMALLGHNKLSGMVWNCLTMTHQRLSTRLQCLHCLCNGDTAVLHKTMWVFSEFVKTPGAVLGFGDLQSPGLNELKRNGVALSITQSHKIGITWIFKIVSLGLDRWSKSVANFISMHILYFRSAVNQSLDMAHTLRMADMIKMLI